MSYLSGRSRGGRCHLIHRDICVEKRYGLNILPNLEAYAALTKAASVDTLLSRGDENDVTKAETAIPPPCQRWLRTVRFGDDTAERFGSASPRGRADIRNGRELPRDGDVAGLRRGAHEVGHGDAMTAARRPRFDLARASHCYATAEDETRCCELTSETSRRAKSRLGFEECRRCVLFRDSVSSVRAWSIWS